MSLTVNTRARRIATFRFIEVRLMEIAAAWTPTTPEMEMKVLLGRHIWDFAQHADWLGKRTFELRQPEHYTLPPVESYAQLMEDISAEDSTVNRLSALYAVFLPALEKRYRAYLAETDPLLDQPSVVIVDRILLDIGRMRDEAQRLRGDLSIAYAPLKDLGLRESSHPAIATAGAEKEA